MYTNRSSIVWSLCGNINECSTLHSSFTHTHSSSYLWTAVYRSSSTTTHTHTYTSTVESNSERQPKEEWWKIKTEHGQNKRNDIQLATGFYRVHIDAAPVYWAIPVRSYYNSILRSYVNRSWKRMRITKPTDLDIFQQVLNTLCCVFTFWVRQTENKCARIIIAVKKVRELHKLHGFFFSFENSIQSNEIDRHLILSYRIVVLMIVSANKVWPNRTLEGKN